MQHKDEKDIERARPGGEGRGNDPHVRDETGTQPGASTISSSPYDEENQHPSKSAADGYKTPFGEDADKTYDE
ncbi:MAG: hypothetical protein EOO08_03860 [Chitinophagaceae bacterium]|nr:MAG: hypothetical protein EOO08_03860 [Chitinophagaceae bacterium]